MRSEGQIQIEIWSPWGRFGILMPRSAGDSSLVHGQVSGKPGDRRVVALGQGYGSEGQSVSKDPASAVGCAGRARGEQCRGWRQLRGTQQAPTGSSRLNLGSPSLR